MRPPDPVTMAMGMERCTIALPGCHSRPSAGVASPQHSAYLPAVLGDPAQEIGQYGLRPAARPPLRVREQPRAVGQIDRNVTGASLRLWPDGDPTPGELAAQRGG